MEENNINSDKQLIELLNQLTQIQAQITAIISTRFDRQTTDNVQSKVSQKQENVRNDAQRYGQDPKLAEGAISDYSQALEEVRREYSTEKNLWLAQSEVFQNNEVKYTLEIAKLKQELENAKKQVEPNKTKKVRPEIGRNNGIEIVEGHHPLLDFNKVMSNLESASLEDVSAQLDYYNGSPVLIDGTSYHPFNDPVSAARLNARYLELTGENHPTFVEQAPKVIDGLLKDAPSLIEAGAYTPMYFEKIARIKNNIESVNEKEEDADSKKQIMDKKEKLQVARESSRESKENIRDCQDRCYETIEDISEDKDLVKADKKQNVFQQLFAKIKDKIGGKEKFNKNVIEPLKNKVSHIKEEVLPNVKNEIQQNVMPKLKSLLEKGKEKVNEMNLQEKFSKLMNMAKEGAKTIVEKSSGVKGIAISAFSKGLSLAKEGISKVAEKVSDVIESATER